MTGFVLDASVTLDWCFADRANPQSEAWLDRLATARARVPTIWRLEVANVLLGAERRGVLTPADGARLLGMLDGLPIDVDATTPGRAWREILSLGRTHGLSSYDAAYLDLALCTGLPLATRDSKLQAAARALGIALL